MRLGFLVLAAVTAGAVSPAGDALRDEVRDVKATQYEKGRQVACNIRLLNAATSQDLAQLKAAERHCAERRAAAAPRQG